jgi:hypothetical protein
MQPCTVMISPEGSMTGGLPVDERAAEDNYRDGLP